VAHILLKFCPKLVMGPRLSSYQPWATSSSFSEPVTTATVSRSGAPGFADERQHIDHALAQPLQRADGAPMARGAFIHRPGG